MSEKLLCVIEANRPAFARTIRETLFFTSDRILVAKTSASAGVMFGALGAIYDSRATVKKSKEMLDLQLEDVLKAHKDNYAISNSEVTKVELKSRMRLNIKTNRKEHKWYGGGLSRGLVLPEKEGKLQYPEDYENTLRPIFGERLLVKK